MSTKEYLKRYKFANDKVRRIEERIERIEATLPRPSGLDGMPRGFSLSDPTQETAIKLADLRIRLEQEKTECEYLAQRIADEIECVERSEYRELLFARYIMLLPWEDVTDRLSLDRKERYDTKHVSGYMHGEALKAFERARECY